MQNSVLDIEQIYREHYQSIQRYLIRFVGHKEAEDLAQEVFIKAGQSLDSFRSEAQVSTWLYRIATHAAIDRMRQPNFRREDVLSQSEADLVGEQSSLENDALRRATNDCIRGVIDSLPENYREPAILSELQGLPNQQIADVLGLSLDVVKVRLHRGKARLRQELMRNCQFSRDERNEFTCDPKKVSVDASSSGKP
jgi:RNA polymerase sigma-70 factor (ECF subfamily)